MNRICLNSQMAILSVLRKCHLPGQISLLLTRLSFFAKEGLEGILPLGATTIRWSAL